MLSQADQTPTAGEPQASPRTVQLPPIPSVEQQIKDTAPRRRLGSSLLSLIVGMPIGIDSILALFTSFTSLNFVGLIKVIGFAVAKAVLGIFTTTVAVTTTAALAIGGSIFGLALI